VQGGAQHVAGAAWHPHMVRRSLDENGDRVWVLHILLADSGVLFNMTRVCACLPACHTGQNATRSSANFERPFRSFRSGGGRDFHGALWGISMPVLAAPLGYQFKKADRTGIQLRHQCCKGKAAKAVSNGLPPTSIGSGGWVACVHGHSTAEQQGPQGWKTESIWHRVYRSRSGEGWP
jgi:hypothetical protein